MEEAGSWHALLDAVEVYTATAIALKVVQLALPPALTMVCHPYRKGRIRKGRGHIYIPVLSFVMSANDGGVWPYDFPLVGQENPESSII